MIILRTNLGFLFAAFALGACSDIPSNFGRASSIFSINPGSPAITTESKTKSEPTGSQPDSGAAQGKSRGEVDTPVLNEAVSKTVIEPTALPTDGQSTQANLSEDANPSLGADFSSENSVVGAEPGMMPYAPRPTQKPSASKANVATSARGAGTDDSTRLEVSPGPSTQGVGASQPSIGQPSTDINSAQNKTNDECSSSDCAGKQSEEPADRGSSHYRLRR